MALSAKCAIAGAIGYSLMRWKAWTPYLEDGRIEIDNNAAEGVLRGVSLGRKNCHFMGSDAGGERTQSTAWWRRPSSVGSTPRRICAKC